MVSESELISRLLSTTTTAIVRRRLEEDFGIDLSQKKKFIREQVDLFLQNEFENAEALSKHILPSDSDEVVSAKLTEKEKADKHQREDPDEPQGKEKRQKGFLAPLQLSDALVKFLGTGENELTWAVVIKRLRDYIKENNLQDPSEKRKVICDEKLKELFDVETFHGFTVTKILVSHFLKT
ncbi:putative Oxygen-evolving enhancer protein 1, chloroplast precursor [Hibiscus syriacus]|uniref:Oxygen-evolving enhancer protein 1, chloroplast n=1 Tax=Hibiscus syriacus TaxID=106335 RepID=A0A6A3AEI5_HIBSY|nr:putative Oxygen-evolving enhancer protein 1, chloroplast precursor [Hibiscus syriacus]